MCTRFYRMWLHFCTKFFLIVVRILIVVNQMALLAPIIRYRNSLADHLEGSEWSVYRTHWLVTTITLIAVVSLTSAAPTLVRIHSSIYNFTSIETAGLFKKIAIISLVCGIAVSLLIAITHLWHRHRLAIFINRFIRIVNAVRELKENFVDCRLMILLCLRLIMFGYELSLSFPFLARHAKDIGASDLFGCLIILLVEHLRSLFAVDMMAVILLLAACYGQLESSLVTLTEQSPTSSEDDETEKKKLIELMQLEQALHNILQLFTKTFEKSLCFLFVGAFVNLLANLYGMVHFSLYSRNLYPMLIFYNVTLIADMYALIYCCHLCCVRHRAVKEAFFRLFYCLRGSSRFGMDASLAGNLQPHLMWPLDVEFHIIGVFRITHEFWLFLVSYAVQFIVIIMEFAVREIRNPVLNPSSVN